MLHPPLEFSRIVSLGALCEVGYQIRRRYGVTPFNPFDWLGTPLSSITEILADDGARFGQKLEVRGDSAFCLEYGINYYHEFARTADRTPLVTERAITVCRRKLRRKYLHFVKQLSGHGHTLFVRIHGHHDSASADYLSPDPRPLNHSELNSIAAAIEQRFPTMQFRLAIVLMSGITRLVNDEPIDHRVLFHMIPPYAHWAGDDEAWDRIFDGYIINQRDPIQVDVTNEHLHP